MRTVANPTRIFTRLMWLGLAAVGVLSAPWLTAGQTVGQGAPQVTFTKDVAPILQRSCQRCHGPNGLAPMALTTYQEVRPWAKAIKQKISSREMPPWFIEKNIGIQRFKDDPSLSDEEIATIARWVDGGVPQGNPADMPPARQFPAAGAWTLNEPDLVVSSPTFTLKAVAADWHGPLEGLAPTGLTEDRWVKSVEVREFRPEEAKLDKPAGPAGGLNLFTVHHSSVNVAAEEQEGEGEGAGARLRSGRVDQLPKGIVSYLYEVGQNPMIFPEDVGMLLPAGAKIEFPNNHLHSIGREVKVQIQVGFTFHPKGFTPKYPRGLSGLPVGGDRELDIPPGEDNVRYDHYVTLPQPVKMVTFEPHLHSSGKRMCQEAIYSNGHRETLNCAGYNHNWVKAYVYDDDVAPLLPAGTILHTTSWFNNTASNPRVVDPRNWKGLGQRSVDDMAFMLSKFLPLKDEEFKEEVAKREAKRSRTTSTAQNTGAPKTSSN